MTLELPAGGVLTVTAAAGSSGTLQRTPASGDTTAYVQTAIAAGTSQTVGPFSQPRNYDAIATAGSVTHTVTFPNEEVVLGDSAISAVSQPTVIPLSRSDVVPADSQALLFTSLTVRGLLRVAGEMRILA